MSSGTPECKGLEFELAQQNHFEWLRDVFSSPEVMKHIPGGVMVATKATQTAEKAIRGADEQGLGYWVVCLKGISAPAGYVVLRPFTWDNQFDGTEIGYIIDRAFWGKGIASMAVKAVMEFALNELKLPQLLALVNDENTASIKIVEKLGFKRSPTKPKNYRDNSVWIKDSE